MPRTTSSTAARRRLERIAARRHGVFTRTHARAAGVADATLDRWCRGGAIERIAQGVYTFASTPRTTLLRCQAALDAAGPGACLGGDAALRLLGIHKHCWSDRDVVVLTQARRRERAGVRFVRSPVDIRDESLQLDGMRLLRLERLLVERAAAGASEAVLCALMDEGAFQRRFSSSRMRRVLDRHARRAGNARLRRALATYLDGDAGAASAFEARCGDRIARVVSGRIERNRRRTIGGMRMRPDMLLPDIAVAVEFDGSQSHSRPTDVRRDAARDRAYARDEITCFRIREAHEHEDMATVIAEVRRRQGGCDL